MTRKDYILIAAAMLLTRLNYGPSWNANLFRALDDASKALADELARDNPRFDRAKFLTACGVN